MRARQTAWISALTHVWARILRSRHEITSTSHSTFLLLQVSSSSLFPLHQFSLLLLQLSLNAVADSSLLKPLHASMLRDTWHPKLEPLDLLWRGVEVWNEGVVMRLRRLEVNWREKVGAFIDISGIRISKQSDKQNVKFWKSKVSFFGENEVSEISVIWVVRFFTMMKIIEDSFLKNRK